MLEVQNLTNHVFETDVNLRLKELDRAQAVSSDEHFQIEGVKRKLCKMFYFA